MSQSLNRIIVHLVFSTKHRAPLLKDEERSALHGFIISIVKRFGSCVIEINSVEDHIHILYVQPKMTLHPKVVEHIKSASSFWLKKTYPCYANFSWQRGYGAFSVCQQHVDVVRRYIQRQQEHHRVTDFKTEYRRVCANSGEPVDERYAWD